MVVSDGDEVRPVSVSNINLILFAVLRRHCLIMHLLPVSCVCQVSVIYLRKSTSLAHQSTVLLLTQCSLHTAFSLPVFSTTHKTIGYDN